MIYKVIKNFADLQDNNHVYFAGDEFPRKGVEVSDERIAELASVSNKRREVLIEAVEMPQEAKIQPQTSKKPTDNKTTVKAETKPKKANKKEK
jgi:hypothetical protein